MGSTELLDMLYSPAGYQAERQEWYQGEEYGTLTGPQKVQSFQHVPTRSSSELTVQTGNGLGGTEKEANHELSDNRYIKKQVNR